MRYNTEYLLLRKLKDTGNFCPSSMLALETGISEKTILKYLNHLKAELQGNGASLEIRPKTGSLLTITDPVLFNAFYEKCLSDENSILTNPETRRKYVLLRLLTAKDYIHGNELAEELYISPSLLRNILHSLQNTLFDYHLHLEHAHHAGYRILGEEKNIRRCLLHECRELEHFRTLLTTEGHNETEIEQIKDIVAASLQKYGISLTDQVIHALSLHVLIALNRAETGNPIRIEDGSSAFSLKSSPEYFAVCRIAEKLKDTLHLELSEDELLYLTIHIAGKQRYLDHQFLKLKAENDDVIFYNRFLRNIYKYTDLDFFEDEDLRSSLMNHIIPFRKRLQYSMQIEKTELSGIRSEFPYAYELALYGLSMYPKGTITQAEISYFALHLELSLEKRYVPEKQFDLAVICDETTNMFQIMSFKLHQHLASRISSIRFIECSSLDRDSFHEPADLLLNASGRTISADVPCIKVSPFLNEDDLRRMDEAMEQIAASRNVSGLTSPDLFLHITGVRKKEEVLKIMTDQIRQTVLLPEDFLERVMAREQMESTALSSGIAYPHPLNPAGIRNFLSAAVMDVPVHWDTCDVSVVFLLCTPSSSSAEWVMTKISGIDSRIASVLQQKKQYTDFMKIFMSL